MLGYKIYSNYIGLKKNFNLLYFKFLIKNSIFIIFFNYNKISNKDLYELKNEMLKKNIKSFIINTEYMKLLFNENLTFLNANTFCIFCNNIDNFIFISNLLNNINFLYLFNKSFINNKYNKIIFNNNFINFHFLIFKFLYNIILIILCYIINIIKIVKC